jgi:hypothetical protein
MVFVTVVPLHCCNKDVGMLFFADLQVLFAMKYSSRVGHPADELFGRHDFSASASVPLLVKCIIKRSRNYSFCNMIWHIAGGKNAAQATGVRSRSPCKQCGLAAHTSPDEKHGAVSASVCIDHTSII